MIVCEETAEVSASSSTATTFMWYDNDGLLITEGPTAILDATADPSQYSVVATDDAGCSTEQFFTIGQEALEINAGEDVSACLEEAITLNASPGSDVDYIWSDDPDFINIISSDPSLDMTTGLTPGEEFVYYVQGTNSSGCVDIDTVIVSNNGVAASLQPPGPNCPEEETPVGIEIALGVPGTLTYTWSSPLATIDDTDPEFVSISSSESTTVTVEVENDLGCSFVQTFDFEVSTIDAEISGDPLEIIQGETTTLTLEGYDPSYTLNWSGHESLSSTTEPSVQVTPTETTVIMVEITDENGCTEFRSVVLTVIPAECNNSNIFFPNAFTPNGDNVNDILRLRGNNVDEVYFAVYNRWGERMFESFSIDQGWDGTFKGKPLANDVYGYYLRVRCADGEMFFQQGNVSLLK